MRGTSRKLALSAFAALVMTSAPGLAAGTAISIVGTGDGIDVLRAMGQAFTEQHKSVEVNVPPSIHSQGGIAAVASKKEILGRVARKLTEAESSLGIVYRPIFRMPSALIVHPSAGVNSVTAAQLADIYAGNITNWKEVGGADLRIRVVRREDHDSTLTVLRKTMPGWKDLVITDKSKMATTTQDAIDTVREVPGAIGFAPYSKGLEQGAVVLKIDGHHSTDPKFPSSVELALIYIESSLTPETRDFISFADSKKAGEVIRSLGSVPVKP